MFYVFTTALPHVVQNVASGSFGAYSGENSDDEKNSNSTIHQRINSEDFYSGLLQLFAPQRHFLFLLDNYRIINMSPVKKNHIQKTGSLYQ